MLPAILLIAFGALVDVQSIQSRAGNVAASADYQSDLDVILAEIVTEDGRVRYDRLRTDLAPLFRSVLKAIEEFDLEALKTGDERFAFWINAYNVQVLQNVLEAPHVEDIIEDGAADDFFRTPLRTARLAISLDQLEHSILRGRDGPSELADLQLSVPDPRLHVALNCAAAGCPRLRRQSFRAETVDSMLQSAMKDFVNDTRHFRREGRRWVFSSILEWFGEDFDAAGRAGDYLAAYVDLSRPDAQALKELLRGKTSTELSQLRSIQFEYDWTVNRARD